MALNTSIPLDELDLQILSLLIKDCRTPYLEIARICHVSGGTIHVRMKKMEDYGIIKGSRILLDLEKLGYDVCCFVGIYVDKASSFNSVFDEMKKINGGGINIGLIIGIGAGVSFLIGLIDGIIRPLKCN